MILIHTAALLALASAVALRVESWVRPQSRPMTLALALSALYTILTYPGINGWVNSLVQEIYGWNNLPYFAASISFIFASKFLARHTLNALDRADLLPVVRIAAASFTTLIIATYALTEAPFLNEVPGLDCQGMTMHTLALNTAAILTHGLMLVCALQSISDSGNERGVIMCYQLAAGIGILASTASTLRVLTPIRFDAADINQLFYVCLFLYACAAILNHHHKRTQPHPEREVIDGMGGTAPIR